MNRIISRLFSKVALVACLATAFTGTVWASEGDTHDFAQNLSQLLNNNASISSINIDAQSYPVKKVIVSYRYNKTLTNAVTVSVSIGSTSWGSQYVEGTGSNYTNLEFSGDAVSGAITISFTNNTGNGTGHGTFYVNNVQLVEGAAGGSPSTVATPQISGSDSFYPSTEVSISCSTDGSTIYYTTDGNDPTTSSSVYSDAFSINATTTVKAKAVKDGMSDSDVASRTFTKITPLANIAALTDKTETASYFVALNNAVVTYVNGNYDYIQDDSGAVAYYKADHGLNAGDVLTGTATVSYQLRNNNPQITSFTGITPVSGSAPDPTIVAASSWAYTFDNVLSQFFQITGATLTSNESKYYVSLNGDNVQLYKAGGSISSLDLGRTYTITGFPTLYNSTKELQIFADPEVEATIDPVISVSPNSLSSFTYEEGNGPSSTKTFTVSGENLTTDINMSLSGSDFEMSLSSSSGYASSLNLTQVAGEVAETTVYVRLKAGLDAGDCAGTITLSSTGATNQTVSLSGEVTAPVVPATLPFEWAGGVSADLLALNGVSASGLGSDYAESNAPYRIKFDTVDDFILIQTDSRPGIVTIGVKMLGGKNTSKIKVQGSADGENFSDVEELTISGSKNDVLNLETSNEFALDARFVKILKSVHGSNIGVGPINIASYVAPSPSISVTPDTATPAANVDNGTFAITYQNITIADMSEFSVHFCDELGASASQPSWVTEVLVAEDNGDYVVSYTIETNDAAARSAYFKVSALADDGITTVYSNLVTITQAAYEIDYATLPFEEYTGNGTGDMPAGLTVSGTGTYSSNPKIKFEGGNDSVILKINESPTTYTLAFDIKGNATGTAPATGVFKLQTSEDGVSYTDLKTYTSISSDISSEQFDNLGENVRYIRWIHVTKTTGNVALGNISLTRPDQSASKNITGTLSNGHYWATFFNSAACYTLSSGAKAYTMNSADHQLYLLGDGDIIPANTAVVIISDVEAITLTKDSDTAVPVSGTDNILHGSNYGVTVSDIPTGTPYVLGIPDAKPLGFYQFTGAEIPANKAYYVE